MIVRITGALLRALLVALMVVTPSLLLPAVSSDTTQIVVLLALIAGAFVFTEYNSRIPVLLEFRYAPPYNRLRFYTLFGIVLLLTTAQAGPALDTPIADLFNSIGRILSTAIDFPYSPVRLATLTLPAGAPVELVNAVRDAAGIAYIGGMIGVVMLALFIRLHRWPTRSGAFNVWINLPMFEPTGGGDVLHRLKRDAGINVLLGFLLPFLTPPLFKLLTAALVPLSLAHPQSLIWIMTAWAFIPANLIMRGIALSRIADLIGEKRRRTYAEEEPGLHHTA
ncbi:hypothetical protein ACX9MO_04000 [Pseudooceanicola sp. 502str34]